LPQILTNHSKANQVLSFLHPCLHPFHFPNLAKMASRENFLLFLYAHFLRNLKELLKRLFWKQLMGSWKAFDHSKQILYSCQTEVSFLSKLRSQCFIPSFGWCHLSWSHRWRKEEQCHKLLRILHFLANCSLEGNEWLSFAFCLEGIVGSSLLRSFLQFF